MRKTLMSLISLVLLTLTLNAANPSGSLPVMYITTEGNVPIESKENYVKGSYYLDPMGAEGVEAFGTADKPLALQIRGRGNYTWSGFEKKPYRLKLDKKAALFGEAKSKHWALLAHADDSRGFLRNAVGFQLSRMAGLPWTPCHHPVEVVLNGNYIGLYFLTETVRVDKDRVNVWDYDSAYEDYADANPGQTLPWEDEYKTGGWLVEIDNYDDAAQIKIESADPYNYESGHVMRITYDTPSDYITDAHKAWLKNEFETLDALIINGDKEKCEWANKIDITNLARFFVVNQIVFNYESFHGSCKLNREKGADSKWNFGPVWDFGSAFQVDNVNQYFFDFGSYSNHWIKTIYSYPAFQEEVKKVYKELRENNFDDIYTFIDSYVASIKQAARTDYERWSHNGYGNNDMDEDKDFVKRVLAYSVKWLDAQWNGGEFDDPTPVDPTSSIYLRGAINSWGADDAYKFNETENGIYTLKLDHLEGEFKIAGPVWNSGNVDYGMNAGEKLGIEEPAELIFGGTNIALVNGSEDNITLIFDWNNKTLTATKGGDVNPTNKYTVYFLNTHSEPWEKVNVFTFNPTLHGDWPGTPARLVNIENDEYWMHSFDKKHNEGDVCLIFNNGKSQGKNQTPDLPIYNNGVYTIDGFTGKYVTTTGIASIVEESNAPAEYYNLQGIRVSNPENGIFILRKGSKSILVRK